MENNVKESNIIHGPFGSCERGTFGATLNAATRIENVPLSKVENLIVGGVDDDQNFKLTYCENLVGFFMSFDGK